MGVTWTLVIMLISTSYDGGRFVGHIDGFSETGCRLAASQVEARSGSLQGNRTVALCVPKS